MIHDTFLHLSDTNLIALRRTTQQSGRYIVSYLILSYLILHYALFTIIIVNSYNMLLRHLIKTPLSLKHDYRLCHSAFSKNYSYSHQNITQPKTWLSVTSLSLLEKLFIQSFINTFPMNDSRYLFTTIGHELNCSLTNNTPISALYCRLSYLILHYALFIIIIVNIYNMLLNTSSKHYIA